MGFALRYFNILAVLLARSNAIVVSVGVYAHLPPNPNGHLQGSTGCHFKICLHAQSDCSKVQVCEKHAIDKSTTNPLHSPSHPPLTIAVGIEGQLNGKINEFIALKCLKKLKGT